MAIFQTCRTMPVPSDPALKNRVENSPIYKNGKFRFNVDAQKVAFGKFASSTWEFFFNDIETTPKSGLPGQSAQLSHFNTQAPDQLNATWLGHSSIMLHIDGYKIMLDPVLSKRLTLVGPSRFKGEIPLTIDMLGDVDVVIISHDHYDHLDKPTIVQLKAKVRQFVVPLAVGARLKKWGIPQNRIVELDWWETHQLDQKLRITATPAQHFSGRGPFDSNKTLWASWVIAGPVHKVFFSGDSGYFDGFKQIGEAHGPFDMTFIECGAYHEAWHGLHMFPEETVQAHLDLGGRILHPIHWGTFKLSSHAWYDPMQRVTAAAAARSVTLATPISGGTTVWGQLLPHTPWWLDYMSETEDIEQETLVRNMVKSESMPIRK